MRTVKAYIWNRISQYVEQNNVTNVLERRCQRYGPQAGSCPWSPSLSPQSRSSTCILDPVPTIPVLASFGHELHTVPALARLGQVPHAAQIPEWPEQALDPACCRGWWGGKGFHGSATCQIWHPFWPVQDCTTHSTCCSPPGTQAVPGGLDATCHSCPDLARVDAACSTVPDQPEQALQELNLACRDVFGSNPACRAGPAPFIWPMDESQASQWFLNFLESRRSSIIFLNLVASHLRTTEPPWAR